MSDNAVNMTIIIAVFSSISITSIASAWARRAEARRLPPGQDRP